MDKINFFNEKTRYRLNHKKKIRDWISAVFQAENSKKINHINLIFCSDSYLLKINQKYLGRETLTDVITFNLSEEKQIIEGEVYISVDRIRENAIIFKSSLQKELFRVIIHGILHLHDYTDDNNSGRSRMQNLENKYLKLLKI